jgi:hypothetical protein
MRETNNVAELELTSEEFAYESRETWFGGHASDSEERL